MLIAGCSGRGEQLSQVLPTATPAPTAAIAVSTPTPLPPPTVTPFPTATARVLEPTVILVTAAESGVSSTLPAGVLPTATRDPARSPTALPAGGGALPAIPPGVNVINAIYSTDFSTGWPTSSEETAKLSLRGGRYIFEVGPFDGRFIATSGVNRGDLYAQTDVIPENCGEGGGYGLFFRLVDSSNYYAFTIFCDGGFTIGARVNGILTNGVRGSLPDGLSASSSTTKRIGVLIAGEQARFFVDGQEVSTWNDSSLEAGDVAVYAVSQKESVMIAAFDKLEVWSIQ